MNKIITIALLLTCLVNTLKAQENPFYESYDWDKKPTYNVPGKDADKPMVELMGKSITEFAFTKDNQLTEYAIEHRVMWLNSDEKIEEYNKVYLPYSSSSSLLVNKARVITKNGKIIELDKDDIHTAKDEESGKNYKYFAFEGVEKGSIIEYYYVEQKHPDYRGVRLTLQTDFERRNIEFDLYSPSNLVFAFKSYNGLPEVERDTISEEDRLHWQLHVKKIEALEEEPVSAYHAQKKYLIYKLDENLANNVSGISSYDKVSQSIFSFLYPDELSRSAEKDLNKFIQKINTQGEEETIIRNVENYIKSNTYLSKGINPDLQDLESVLNEKVGNSRGIMKLYTSIFSKLGIKHEVVITSDRMEVAFDKEFESGNFLNEFLLYFPKEDTYMAPTDLDTRYGYPPSEYTDNYGLFIKKVKVGSFVSGVGEIKYINPLPADKSYEKMIVEVAFDKQDITNCSISLDRIMFGYYAAFIQPYLNLVKEDDKEKLIKSMAEQLSEDITIKKQKIVDEDPTLFGIKPLAFKIDFTSTAFVEKAGDKLLFKVGKLIGKQTEMYQEKERVLPLEESFMRKYMRTLRITIPEGYEINNLDDINIAENYEKNGKELLGFKSTYTLKGNQLIIQADEHYSTNKLSAEEFNNYRKVINAAADFNKITLLLAPKS